MKDFLIFTAAIVSCLASTMSTATDYNLFEESKLCVAQLNNLIDRQTTEDEVVCQELCQSFTQCSHFTFVENKYPLETGEPNLQCYLWKRCIKKVSCSSMDCTSSVSGPTLPNMLDSCCSHFQSGVCNSPALRSLPAMDEGECQRRCRADKDCLFYSTSPNACNLHSSCPSQRNPCQGCRSGPKRPPLDKLPVNCGDDITTPTTTAMTSTGTTTMITSTSTTATTTYTTAATSPAAQM